MGGGTNFVLGDDGRVIVNRDAQDQIATRLIETLNGSVGGQDSIAATGGFNVVLGGANDDWIRALTVSSTAQFIALGDNGSVLVDFQDRPLRIRSLEEAEGGNDIITTSGQDDILIGGFGKDQLSTDAGNNILIGDTGDLTWEILN